MINPLLIARKENAGILRKICSELGAEPREMSGDGWSLELFIKSDLKNYLYQSHYVLDVSAFKEKDDDFIAYCEAITYQKDNANIVIYADQYYPGDSFLDRLVHKGFHNIVANYPDVDDKTNITMMMEDLKECLTGEGLSKKKWRRYDNSYDALAEAREAALLAEKEKEKLRFSQAELHIAVVGAQSRIGTTTFAMRLAKYFQSRNAESVVVNASQRSIDQLEMMKEYYEIADENPTLTINGVDMISRYSESDKRYNAEIYDFGSTQTSELDLSEFDKIYIIGGTSWNELPMIYEAQIALNKVNYSVAVNFSNDAAIENFRDILSLNLNDVLLLPYEPDPFDTAKYDEIFDKEFAEWADVESI